MSAAEIVCRIHDTIRDVNLPRAKKIAILENLAVTYWKEVFPEYKTPAFDDISADDMATRWTEIRAESGLDRYENREQILYVLDWPASGGNFYWVE